MTRLEAEGIDLRLTAGHQNLTARLESETFENCQIVPNFQKQLSLLPVLAQT